MSNELINGLKDLISAYDTRENGNDEITMWREKFLGSLRSYEDKEFAAKVWNSFLYMPSTTMMEKSPHEWIKEIEEEIKSCEN